MALTGDVNDRAYELGRKQGLAQGLRHAPNPATFTASARRINLQDPQEASRLARSKKTEQWQGEAWGYFDSLPEVKFAARYKARSLSKLRLIPAMQIEPGRDPVPLAQLADLTDVPPGVTIPSDAQVAVALDPIVRLEQSGGTAAVLERWGYNGFVAGEGYLVAWDDPAEDSGERVVFASRDELRTDEKGQWFYVEDPDDKPNTWIRVPPEALMVRVWNQHARWASRPDSSVRGVLDVCEELLVLGHVGIGQGYARLNNGVWLVPRTMLANPRPRSDENGANEISGDVVDPVLERLVDVLSRGFEDPRTAAAVVPFIMSADKDDIEAASKGRISFDRPFDRVADQKIERCIRRLATGVDLPTEIITGMAESNHWTAWLISDESFRSYIEPDAQQFVGAVTIGYYRPLLSAAGLVPDLVRRLVMWYDASDLVSDPDETDRTFKARELDIIGGQAARSHLGYNESEAPTPEEIAQATPAPADQGEPVTPAGGTGQEPDTVTAAARRRLSQLSRRLTSRDRSLMDRLLALCDAAMFRALERAGAKLRTKAIRASALHGEIVQHVPNVEVTSMLGRGIVAAAGVTPEDLLEGQFDEVGRRFASMVAIAQAATRRDLLDLGLGDDDEEELAATQEEDRNRAAGVLVTSLTSLALSRMFDPHPAAPMLGEHDSTLSIPAGVVREALSHAGGAQGTARGGGAIVDAVTDRPAGGVATGETIASYLARLHVSTSAWVWRTGDPDRPFEPHQELDGTEFSAWTADELVNSESWPSFGNYFPGDHDGCECLAEPVLEQDEPPAGD